MAKGFNYVAMAMPVSKNSVVLGEKLQGIPIVKNTNFPWLDISGTSLVIFPT